MSRQKTNLQAEAFGDQVRAAIRNGEEIPCGPICEAAARTIKTDGIQSPAFRLAANRLLQSWADRFGVDRPNESEVE